MGKWFRLYTRMLWVLGITYIAFLAMKILGLRSFDSETFTFMGLLVFFVTFLLDATFVVID